MMTLDEITKKVLEQIDASGFKQSGAFNLRHNGIALCHGDSEHIKIKKKQDKPGIDIYIDGKTDGEEVHIPVVVDATGMTDVVYNVPLLLSHVCLCAVRFDGYRYSNSTNQGLLMLKLQNTLLKLAK